MVNMKKIAFLLVLAIFVSCKDNDEYSGSFFPSPASYISGISAVPYKSVIKYPAQGGSEVLDWYGCWSCVYLLNEYPASLYNANFDEDGRAKVEEDHILGGLFYQDDNEYAIKHPIEWTGDTLKGEWFRIVRTNASYNIIPDIARGIVIFTDERICSQTLIEVTPNISDEGRVLVFAPYCGEPVFILQDKMED